MVLSSIVHFKRFTSRGNAKRIFQHLNFLFENILKNLNWRREKSATGCATEALITIKN